MTLNKPLNTWVMLFIITAIFPQRITREKADRLAYALSQKFPDSPQINILLKKGMSKLFIICVFLLVQLPSFAQYLNSQEVEEAVTLLQNSKPDTNKIAFLLKLGQHHIYKPGETKEDLDSALNLVREAEQLSQQLQYDKGLGKSYWVLSEAFREKSNKEHGMQYIEQAIDLFTKNNYQEELGDAFMEKRHYYSIYATSEEISMRIQMAEQAQEAYQRANNLLKLAKSLQELGDIHAFKGEYRESIQKLNESLKVYESVGYERVHGIYDLLGAIYTMLGDSNEGLRYGLLAVKTAEMVQDSSSQLSTIYNRVGGTYYYLNKLEPAMEYFQKALEIVKKNNDLTSVVFLDINIVNTLLRLQRPLEALAFHQDIVRQYPAKERNQHLSYTENSVAIYQDLKQYDQAQEYCDKLLKLANEVENDSRYPILSYNKIIRFFLASGQYQMTQKYLPTFLEAAKITGEPRYLSSAYELWFELDSALGNYQSALSHYQQHRAWEDSIINEKKNKQIALIQIQYETEKKDQELKLKEQNIEILTQRGDLQETRLQQANFTRNVTFGGILLMIVVGFIFYRQYRQKQQANKTITLKNNQLQHLLIEKEWLLKEIHHRVKNNLHRIICLLESQATYLEKDALKAIENSQHRIYAMSLIHQKLYQLDNQKSINMATYIPEFIQYLGDGFGTSGKIRFELNIEEIQLDVSQAVPIALILNEAVTNSIIHGFPGDMAGVIQISMHQSGNEVSLVIADSGIGMDQNIDFEQLNSLGLVLIKGLSEDINAQIRFENNDGTMIILRFNAQELSESNYQNITQESVVFT